MITVANIIGYTCAGIFVQYIKSTSFFRSPEYNTNIYNHNNNKRRRNSRFGNNEEKIEYGHDHLDYVSTAMMYRKTNENLRLFYYLFFVDMLLRQILNNDF